MLVCTLLGWATGSEAHEREIVVYGGSAGGIVAGIQAKRMGKSVVVIEPTRRIGGLTTGGLGQTDIGNKGAIGGLSRDFYRAVRQHYQAPQAWKWQSREAYRSGGQSQTSAGEDAMWTFEPSVALAILEAWVAEHGLEVVRGERLPDRLLGKLVRVEALTEIAARLLLQQIEEIACTAILAARVERVEAAHGHDERAPSCRLRCLALALVIRLALRNVA